VTADSKAIELLIDADPRLAAAAGGAARYLADSAGLAGEDVGELQKSVVAACEEAFEHLTGEHPHLKVTIERFPDRIEVALAHKGDAEPALGLDRIAGFVDRSAGAHAMTGIDRVQFEAQGGVAITRLTKYLGRAPHIA
jgi:hypothetical protein